MSPPDLPRTFGLFMALGTVVVVAGFGVAALGLWPDLAARLDPQAISQVAIGPEVRASR